MFGFLKDKLKSAISVFSRKAEEEAKPVEEPVLSKEEPIKPAEIKKEVQEHRKALPSHEEAPKKGPIHIPKPHKEHETEKIHEPKREEPKKEETKILEPKKQDTIHIHKKEGLRQSDIKISGPIKHEPLRKKAEAISEEIPEPVKSEPAEEKKKGFFQRIKEKRTKEPEIETPERKLEHKLDLDRPKTDEKTVGEKHVEAQHEEKGFFQKIKEKVQSVTITQGKFDEMFWGLEVVLLENNVAVEVIEKIKSDLSDKIVDQPIRRGTIEEHIIKALSESVKELFITQKDVDLLEMAKTKKPYVICFVGVNGSGKTTTIAKVAHMFQKNHMSVVLAAADTFRAAAIDQLQLHADKLGVKLIKQDYGSDAAAVAFDAIKHAESKNKDVVLIDTAGRLHSNQNLMDEMKKVVRVAKPDMVVFVGESITGNDCVEQAKLFSSAVQIDGIILSKADVDEKGGAAISISYVTHKPILYIGTGQEYDDLKKFDSKLVVQSLGLSA